MIHAWLRSNKNVIHHIYLWTVTDKLISLMGCSSKPYLQLQNWPPVINKEITNGYTRPVIYISYVYIKTICCVVVDIYILNGANVSIGGETDGRDRHAWSQSATSGGAYTICIYRWLAYTPSTKQYVAQYTEQRSHWRSIEMVYWYPYAKASYSCK